MASIFKKKDGDGTNHWCAIFHITDHTTICHHVDEKQEPNDWESEVKRKIKPDRSTFDRNKQQVTKEMELQMKVSPICVSDTKAELICLRRIFRPGFVALGITLQDV